MPEPPPQPLCIRLLGHPRFSLAQGPDVTLLRKDAALLALLALGGATPRERLARWLWPEAEPSGALLNLRQRLHKLRRQCGRPVVTGGPVLALAEGVQTDVTDPAGPVDDSEVPLLGALDCTDLPDFDAWLQGQRRRLQRQRADRRAGEAARLESAGSLAAAIDLCERIVADAPGHEHSWRRLMRLHYLRGDRAAAVATFERFEREVCAQQGTRPTAETLELLRTVERLDARPAGPAPLPPALVRPPQQVGRDEAMRALAAAWHAGRAVLVLGDGGIGKTRLLEEALRARPGALQVKARPGDAATPYATATALLRQAVERFAPPVGDADRSELARLLPEWGDAPQRAVRQDALWRAMARVLGSSRSLGLAALVVDDLHQADAATLEWLRWWLGDVELQGVSLAFAARPAEGEGARLQDWLADSTRIEAIRLQPLDRPQVLQLLQSLALVLPGRALPELAEALHRHAGGHPFYTLETVKGWVLGGDLDAPLPRPAAVAALLERRLRTLSPAATQLLQLAALAGAELPPEVAAEALGQPLLALAPAWLELERAQVLHGAGFAHDLLREAALALLPETLRPALHARLAQALGQHPGTPAATRAGHWQRAGRWREAAALWAEAAAAARRAGRLAECANAHERADEAWGRAGEDDAAFEAACHGVAALLLHRGETVAMEWLDGIEPRIAQRPARQARWSALRAECLLNLARYDEALQATTAALAHQAADSALRDDAETLHGRALALTGRAAEGVALLQQAVAHAEARGDAARGCTATAALAHALQASGRIGEALRAQQRVLDLAGALGDDTEAAVHQANLVSLAYTSGETALCRQQGTQALQRLRRLQSDGAQTRFCALMVVRSAAALGRFDEALERAGDLADRTPATDPAGRTVALLARNVLATLQLWLGCPQQALQVLGPVEPEGHPIAQAGAWLARRAALQALDQDPTPCDAPLQALDRQHPELRHDLALGLLWARLGPPCAADAWLRRARARLRGGGTPALVRTLDVRRVQRLLEFDPAAAALLARRLAAQLHLGLHASQYPPEAWWLLACALRDADAALAEGCRLQALKWIDQARLPEPVAAWRKRFLEGNPHNRVVLASAPMGPQ